MSEFRGVLYVVAGAYLYKVLNDYSYTTIGTADLDFDDNRGKQCRASMF
jgi:hypothetical protein